MKKPAVKKVSAARKAAPAGAADAAKPLLDLGTQTLLDAIPDFIYVKDAQLRNRIINKAFLAFLRRSPEDILGKTDDEILPAALAEACRKSDLEALQSRKAVRFEEVSRDSEGRMTVYETIKAPFYRGGREPVGVVGISRDVTAERRMVQSLRETEDRLRRVMSDAPVVVFAIDREGTFTLSEGKSLERLGLKPGEVVGRSIFEVYGHNPVIIDAIRRTLGGEAFTEVVNEGSFFFETHFAPLHGAAGEVCGVIGVSIDVTDRVRADREREEHLIRERSLRQEAEEANRAKDDFLALLSHELRTPMTAMLGWMWLLRSKGMNAAEAEDALRVIERNMKSQSQIIEDLLDISRIVTGKLRVEAVPVQVLPLILASMEVVRPAADAKSIKILLPKERPELMVLADGNRLQQALWNLLSNAVKFTPEGGTVQVGLRREGRNVEISIKDSGVGIPAEHLERIFNPFSQVEKAMTREHGGLGLGLCIVRHIAELHGGTVCARSEGGGRGSEFILALPMLVPTPGRPVPAEPRSGAGKGGAPVAADLRGIQVLVVDDDADTRAMLSAALEHCGAKVRSAGSAAEGYASLLRKKPHVLILDIAMPGEDGISLLRRIRALGPKKGGDIPAAALTARIRTEDRMQVLMSGFQMYLPKPIDPAELAAVVHNLAAAKPRRVKRPR
ncbi:MAG: hypothetical protein A2X36_05425 [Elusimicrobia bacterium GWA2_69_24]|nr:MAG: hypothetical protein A2X36_05425 [Elusimicrobia bacterium GWA2_69_24]HBL15997.1 hypothetical protein [Elusimicrobiota bacterium]